MSPTNHFVFIGINEVSHLRLLLQLALNLLDLHPSLITSFIIADGTVERFDSEYDLQPISLIDRVEARFRREVIDTALVGPSQQAKASGPAIHGLDAHGRYKDGLAIAVQEWIGGKREGRWATVPCGFGVDPFLCDFIHSKVDEVVGNLGLKKIPTWHVNGSSAVGHHRLFASPEQGGQIENVQARYEANVATGMEEAIAMQAAIRWNDDRLLCFPDLPQMYGYEFMPQIASRGMPDVKLFGIILGAARNVDAFVCSTIPEFEEATIPWLEKSMGMPIIGVGPQFNETVWNALKHNRVGSEGSNDARILHFLDDALKQYGTNSAVWISLGSWIWPKKRIEMITNIIDSLLTIEPPLPFVFKLPTKDNGVPDSLVKKVEESGRGIFTDWAPQVKVLQHEATGMFLTHCGLGSVMETIMAGVPIIALPFGADQPELAAHYCVIHGCGVQLYQLSSLFESRTFANGIVVDSTSENMQKELKETWKRMRGEDGERYRRNCKAVGEVIRRSAETGGSKKNMLRFSDYFTDHE